MKFSVAFVVATALGLMGIQNVAGQECDAEAYATLMESFLGSQSLVQCLIGLNESYTFGNEKENAAIAALFMYNQSGYDALDQGNCSALNESVLGSVSSFFYLGYSIQNDSAARRSGLYEAYIECAFPEGTCDFNLLNLSIYSAQYSVGCYLTLANGSYPLTEDQAELLDLLFALNETAVYAAIANQCDTLKTSLIQLEYTASIVTELIYNGSVTNVSDALTRCLFPEPTCSIEALNATLNKYEPVFDCLCELEYLFNLTDPESEKLDDADKAYVNACLDVEGGDSCSAVSDDVQSFLDAIQEFIDYATGNNESSADFVNAVKECANLSSTAE